RRPPRSALFPYTTLFRSRPVAGVVHVEGVRRWIWCRDLQGIGGWRVLRQKDGVAAHLIGDGLDVAVVQVIDVVVDVDDVAAGCGRGVLELVAPATDVHQGHWIGAGYPIPGEGDGEAGQGAGGDRYAGDASDPELNQPDLPYWPHG